MPGRLFLTSPVAEAAEFLGADATAVLDEPPRLNIAPGQEILACPADRRLRRMRWGIIPVGRVNARGRPVMETIVNARSETVFSKSVFEGVHRCLVPADGWYEWTGEKRKKKAWRLRRPDARPLAFAAIWDVWTAPGGHEVVQVATITCEPSRDVKPVHHRMGVLLDPDAFGLWLHGDETALKGLMAPYPDGSLVVEAVGDFDWSVD